MRERPPYDDILERWKAALVERNVFVAISYDLVEAQRRHCAQLPNLVPWHQRHHVHFASLELIDARGGVGQELEQHAVDLRVLGPAPIIGYALEQDVLASLPLGHAIWP